MADQAQPQMVNITIDDIKIAVPPGTLVVNAAKTAGIDIPIFCSHPKLDPLGACRMCLVEIEGPRGPMLQTSCTVPVTEGMVVHTNTPKVVDAQRGTLEFILSNHPLDCPICDKGGECPLQNNTLAYGPGSSVFVEPKIHKNKHYPISDLIMLDQERCILCWRCIRYLQEWEDKPQLGLFERGGETIIDIFPGEPVDAKTSGNIVDICPVGALTDRMARFRFRPWEIKRNPTICTHCSVGCNILMDTRLGEVRRVMARENLAVNDEWICDKGRFVTGYIHHPQRLLQPMLRDGKGGELRPATWDEALARVVEALSHIPADQVGGLGSSKLSNEANYLFQKFLRGIVGTNNIDHRGGSAVAAVPTGLGNIQDVGTADVILLVGADPSEEQPILELFIKRAARRKNAKIIVAHPRRTELTRYDGAYLGYRPGTEAVLLNGLLRGLIDGSQIGDRGRTYRGFSDLAGWLQNSGVDTTVAQTGVDVAQFSKAVSLLGTAKRPLVIYGPMAAQGINGAANLSALTNLAMALGDVSRLAFVGLDANSQGARDTGCLPNRLPGHAGLDDTEARGRCERAWNARVPATAGMGREQMFTAAANGRLKALYCMGTDPASESPAAAAALRKLDFLVVQELFLTETAKLADVVLPATSYAETSGSYTNLERRVQRAPQAIRPLGQCAPDWSILMHLANRWPVKEEVRRPKEERRGVRAGGGTAAVMTAPPSTDGRRPLRWSYATVGDVLAEIGKVAPIYAGCGWEDLDGDGKQWPVSALRQPASSYSRVTPQMVANTPDYPLALTSSSLLYDAGTMFERSGSDQEVHKPLLGLVPQKAWAGLNPADIQKYGLSEGEPISVVTPDGKLRLVVKADQSVAPGTVWVPDSLPEAPVGTLLDGNGLTAAARVEK